MHIKPKKYSVFSLIKNALSYHENWQPAWRSPEPKKEYDAIIVGGGGHGLTTAYYLAKNFGITNIAIVEEQSHSFQIICRCISSLLFCFG